MSLLKTALTHSTMNSLIGCLFILCLVAGQTIREGKIQQKYIKEDKVEAIITLFFDQNTKMILSKLSGCNRPFQSLVSLSFEWQFHPGLGKFLGYTFDVMKKLIYI